MEKAKILVNASRKRGIVSPLVYGSFLEHLGRCIYGGVWAEKTRNGKFAGDDPNHCGVVAPWLPFGEQDRKKGCTTPTITPTPTQGDSHNELKS